MDFNGFTNDSYFNQDRDYPTSPYQIVENYEQALKMFNVWRESQVCNLRAGIVNESSDPLLPYIEHHIFTRPKKYPTSVGGWKEVYVDNEKIQRIFVWKLIWYSDIKF